MKNEDLLRGIYTLRASAPVGFLAVFIAYNFFSSKNASPPAYL
jgi:hypothetical protein